MASITDFIDEQPDVLARVMHEVSGQSSLSHVLDPEPRRLYLVGSGTSRNALEGVQYELAALLDCEVRVVNPHAFMTLVPERQLADSAAVFLSQTGASTTTIEALRYARARGLRTLALTAERDSQLAGEAETVVVMPIGDEPLGPKTKGYTGSIASLLSLIKLLQRPIPRGKSEALWGDVEREFIAWFREQLPACHELGKTLANGVQHLQDFAFFATGRHLATAAEASLKVTEMAGVPASVFDAEEGLHGRFHGLGKTSLAVLITSTGPEEKWMRSAAKTLTQLGIPTLLVMPAIDDVAVRLTTEAMNSVPELDFSAGPAILEVGLRVFRTVPAFDLLAMIMPFQCLAYHLALLRDIRPEIMRYPGLSARLGIKAPPK